MAVSVGTRYFIHDFLTPVLRAFLPYYRTTMQRIFGVNITVLATGNRLQIEQVIDQATALVEQIPEVQRNPPGTFGRFTSGDPHNEQAPPARPKAYPWGMNPMREPTGPPPKANAGPTPFPPPRSVNPKAPTQAPGLTRAEIEGRTPKAPSQAPGLTRAEIEGRRPKAPFQGRGLIHVPKPVMPYNDISNDHFLNKSPHQ